MERTLTSILVFHRQAIKDRIKVKYTVRKCFARRDSRVDFIA